MRIAIFSQCNICFRFRCSIRRSLIITFKFVRLQHDVGYVLSTGIHTRRQTEQVRTFIASDVIGGQERGR